MPDVENENLECLEVNEDQISLYSYHSKNEFSCHSFEITFYSQTSNTADLLNFRSVIWFCLLSFPYYCTGK